MSRNRWWWLVVVGSVVALVAAAGGWSLRTMLASPADVLEAPGYTLVAAQQGTVGHSVRLNTTVEWMPVEVAVNRATGTVTSRELVAGAEARPGEALYTVDLRPVVVARGEVPAFRDLAVGVEGVDVAQLQELLAELGFYAGRVDGRFGEGVYWAVRAWQRNLGGAVDGTVRRGDVVFVADLWAGVCRGASW